MKKLSELSYSNVVELFHEVRSEMFLPRINVLIEYRNQPPNIIPAENEILFTLPRRLLSQPEILKWYLRMLLAHAHYCPYNARIALVLHSSAFDVLGDWEKAYTVVSLFSRLQIDCIYLPLRYRSYPIHLLDEFRSKPKGIDIFRYSVYRTIFGEFLPKYRLKKDIDFYGRIAAKVILSYRPWTHKVKALSFIFSRLEELGYDLSVKGFRKHIPLSEDFRGKSKTYDFREIMGDISNREEAEAFYRYWIQHRFEEDIRREKLRALIKETRGSRHGKSLGSTLHGEKNGEEGEEPELPTSLSSPLRKIDEQKVREALWRSFWYRSRAEKMLLRLIKEGRTRRSWSTYAYTVEWLIEDDLEDLDLESTFDEGSFLPEVTTVKPVYKPSPTGGYLSRWLQPPTLVVIDTSKSMHKVLDEASIAALALLFSAHRSGAETAVINFSRKYIYVGWKNALSDKELVLSIPQLDITILPIPAIEEAIKELKGKQTLITVITDCGWQNLREALSALENISSRGHKLVVYHIEGGKYPRNIDVLKRHQLTLYRIRTAEDLKHIISELIREIL